MKKKFCLAILTTVMLCFTACTPEEVEKETLPPENINSLLDKYGEESGEETKKVADNEETTTSLNTIGTHDHTTASTADSGQSSSSNIAPSGNTSSSNTISNNVGGNNQSQNNSIINTTKNNTTKQTTGIIEETTTPFLKVEVEINTDVSIATTPKPSGGTIIIGGNEDSTTSPAATSGVVCGNVNWKLEDSTLTIYGNGEMVDYNYASTAPWYPHRSSIKSIIVSSGITYIGKSAFGNSYTAVEYVSVADTVTSIGPNAFFNCSSLIEIKMSNNLVSAGDDCFRQCERLQKINLPASFSKAGSFIFQNSYPTVYGVSGSYAQTIASVYGLSFVAQ